MEWIGIATLVVVVVWFWRRLQCRCGSRKGHFEVRSSNYAEEELIQGALGTKTVPIYRLRLRKQLVHVCHGCRHWNTWYEWLKPYQE